VSVSHRCTCQRAEWLRTLIRGVVRRPAFATDCLLMSAKPWYQSGLRFKCTQCGNCCTGAPGYVWVNKEEIQALAQNVGESDVSSFEDMYVRKVGIRKSLREYPNGDCVFFDNESRTCTVYEARPRQCRSWPFWGSNLRTPEDWGRTGELCPGCGKGKLYQLEDIEQQRSSIRV
jgi:Fe-S-cluster containining protein